jgi:iron complex outermembrane receptor protein
VSNFQLIAGYAYADSIISKDRSPINVGARGLNAPKHNFNLWARYDLPGGGLKGLGFGAGIVHQSDRAGSTPLATVPAGFQPLLVLPAFTRVDASLYYVTSRYEFTFRIANLFDELYYESANAVTNIYPGAPREGTLSVRLRF